MEKLVLKINGDIATFNNRYRFNLGETNIPREYGLFREDFFWSAKILKVDEHQKVIYAEIQNYNAQKHEFETAKPLPYFISKIHFFNLDHEAIKSCIAPAPNFFLAGDLLIDDKWRLIEGSSINLSVRSSQLIERSTHIYVNVVFNDSPLKLKLCDYEEDTHQHRYPSSYLVNSVLNKDTLDIAVSMKNGELYVSSPDLQKVIFIDPVAHSDLSPTKTTLTSPDKENDFLDVNTPPNKQPISYKSKPESSRFVWVETRKVLSVKLADLTYNIECVEFWIRCEDYGKEVKGTISNSLMTPEFKYIQRYFGAVIGKQSIQVDIVLRQKQNQYGKVFDVEIISAKSTDIDKINSTVISAAQKNYCVDHLFSTSDENSLANVDELLGKAIKDSEKFSASALIDVICEKREDTKHALELKYLAGKHLAEIQPLKFGGEQAIKSFLFLVEGRNTNFLVLEAIDAKLATYIWSCPQSLEEFLIKIKEIESLVTSLEDKKRRKYDGFAKAHNAITTRNN